MSQLALTLDESLQGQGVQMSDTWRPLSERENPSGNYDIFTEGVPPWLFESLMAWIANPFEYTYQGNRRYDLDAMKELERRSKRALPGSSGSDKWDSLRNEMTSDEHFMLDAVDFALDRFEFVDGDEALELEAMLNEAGSTWKVAVNGERWRLVRRLAAATEQAAEAAMSVADRAADHLSESQSLAFGRSPNSSTAYREAVRAVEAAAKPVISPNDGSATLGRMIGQLRAGPDRFRSAFDHEGFSGIAYVIATLDLLWKGEHDRHGTDDVDTEIYVDQSAAEAAVHLAVTLVEWFRSGVVSRNG